MHPSTPQPIAHEINAAALHVNFLWVWARDVLHGDRLVHPVACLPMICRDLAPIVGDIIAREGGLFVSDLAMVYSRGSFIQGAVGCPPSSRATTLVGLVAPAAELPLPPPPGTLVCVGVGFET